MTKPAKIGWLGPRIALIAGGVGFCVALGGCAGAMVRRRK
jgi:hypothetical protein